MNQMNCPHCRKENIAPEDVPNGVVAIMPCPNCSQLLVRFHDKVIALNKDILVNGSKEERTFHIAEVIAEFIDEIGINFDMMYPHMFGQSPKIQNLDDGEEEEIEVVDVTRHHQTENPISDDEAQRFIDFELNAMDNIDYFKKHLE